MKKTFFSLPLLALVACVATGCANFRGRIADEQMLNSARFETANHLTICLPYGPDSLNRLKAEGQVIFPEKSLALADPKPLGDYYNGAEGYGADISLARFIFPERVPWVIIRLGGISNTITYK